MANFVFRSRFHFEDEDPPELVWSKQDKKWFIEKTASNIEIYSYYFDTLCAEDNDPCHRLVTASYVRAVIVGFRESERDGNYCAQFAAVVDGMRSRHHRFMVLTIFGDDAKHLVERLETFSFSPLWEHWLQIGENDGKLTAFLIDLPTRQTEGYYEDKNFAEDLEALAFFAQNWAQGKKGLEAGQVFDVWWWDCKPLPCVTQTIPNPLD